MAQSFTCPSCGAPLDYEGGGQPTIPCPYCFSSVIVPQELRFERAAPVAPEVTMSLMGQAANLREMANLVRTRQFEPAAHLYQQIYQVSREDALRVVRQLAQGHPAVISSSVSSVDLSALGESNWPPSSGPSAAKYPVPPVTVYTTSPSSTGRSLRIGVGCFVAFILFIVGVTTAVPLLITLVAGGATLGSVQSPLSTGLAGVAAINATTTAVFVRLTREANATPSPTLTITPAPTDDATATAEIESTATALAEGVATQRARRLLLSDKFDKKANGWVTGDERNTYYTANRVIKDGVYRWTMTAKKGFYTVMDSGSKQYKDFYAALDVKVIDGPATADAALVFRNSSAAGALYYFAVRGDGTYAFSLLDSSGWQTLIDWTASPAIQVGEVNRIAVSAKGSQFIFLINDQVVDHFDDDSLTSGTIGIGVDLYDADDKAVFEFDNLEIRAP